jgi:hypothetical protein
MPKVIRCVPSSKTPKKVNNTTSINTSNTTSNTTSINTSNTASINASTSASANTNTSIDTNTSLSTNVITSRSPVSTRSFLMSSQLSPTQPLFINDKINRNPLAQYTNDNREVRNMKDDTEFLDYAQFLMRQQDVHITENTRMAIETTKNAKNIKTYSEVMKVIQTVFYTLLAMAIVAIIITIFIYFFVYRKDIVKRGINFELFKIVLNLLILFALFVFMYMNMTYSIKKIMSLL